MHPTCSKGHCFDRGVKRNCVYWQAWGGGGGGGCIARLGIVKRYCTNDHAAPHPLGIQGSKYTQLNSQPFSIHHLQSPSQLLKQKASNLK